MSNIKFNGTEPIIKRYPANSKVPFAVLPPSSPTPPVSPQLVDEPEKKNDAETVEMEERKEEIVLNERQIDQCSQESATINAKLDRLMDNKFAGVYNRLRSLENRANRVDTLLRGGARANDSYWEFNNWSDIKGYGAVAGMAARCYAMIFDAIKWNDGVLRNQSSDFKKAKYE